MQSVPVTAFASGSSLQLSLALPQGTRQPHPQPQPLQVCRTVWGGVKLCYQPIFRKWPKCMEKLSSTKGAGETVRENRVQVHQYTCSALLVTKNLQLHMFSCFTGLNGGFSAHGVGWRGVRLAKRMARGSKVVMQLAWAVVQPMRELNCHWPHAWVAQLHSTHAPDTGNVSFCPCPMGQAQPPN